MHAHWEDVVRSPIDGRTSKPRKFGVTMVIDKGLGVMETSEIGRAHV